MAFRCSRPGTFWQSSRRVRSSIVSNDSSCWERKIRQIRADGIQTVWITTKDANWLWALPGLKLLERDKYDDRETQEFDVVRGLAMFKDNGWDISEKTFCSSIISEILREHRVPQCAGYLYEEVPLGLTRRRRYHHQNAVALVSSADAEKSRVRADEIERNRLRQQEKYRIENDELARSIADNERRIQNTRALEKRQDRVIMFVHRDVLHEMNFGDDILVGVPSRPLTRDLDLSARGAKGSEATAFGSAVWIKSKTDGVSLFGIVCPVASRITPGLASSWRKRGVRIYVGDLHEAARIANVLRWPLETLRICEPDD